MDKKRTKEGKIKLKFCIDLRQINAATAKDTYSLPRISEVTNALSGANYFTSIDADRAFFQVELA